MSSTLESITDELTSIIAKTLNAYHSVPGESIKIVALDFHPWNGFLALAILTESEVATDPLLDDLTEMAAWKHYDFGANLDDWDVNSILTEMKAIYDEIQDAQLLFQCCASAMASASVQQALSRYSLADGFRISVANPDDNVEYFT
ncbi:hypothetical protein Pan97_24250 [Bremerella volcania]|uniref:DUF4303 domain-containing protein n=1 Tax=Bremerella volcania TaxID=2527984 RepID=A0A518C835_9BACT|nr:hypothetical protein [Bremerella volcania]QDU75393.1 hypothetical protein Pan97_24250 [Bremerella volcania]